jgi:AraC-like DNA-binding protein
MSATIQSMHDDPTHRWTLQKLAKRAGMSRSVFALKFKQKLGTLLCAVDQRIHMSVLCIADRLTRLPCVLNAIFREKIYIRWCCIDRLSSDRLAGPILIERAR